MRDYLDLHQTVDRHGAGRWKGRLVASSNTLHIKAKEVLEKIREEQRERNQWRVFLTDAR